MEKKKQKIEEYIMSQIKTIDYFEGDWDKKEYADEWAKGIVKLFSLPDIKNSEAEFCECMIKDPEIKAMWVVCANCKKPIKDE